VTKIVELVPEHMFELAPASPSFISHESTDSLNSGVPSIATNAQESARSNIIRELVETERKYVQDLEVMQVRFLFSPILMHLTSAQKYSVDLSQFNIMSQDMIHCLFPNLNKLLNFQRKFLIRLESTAELPWKDQRWGLHFIENVSLIVFFHIRY
jgi:cell division control protein 24